MAYERGGDFLEDARKILNREVRGPRQSRFSIGSAPLTSITKSDAQISGGETRQDYKDTRRFPLGGSLVRSPVPAFRFTGVIPLLWPRFLIPRLTLSSG